MKKFICNLLVALFFISVPTYGFSDDGVKIGVPLPLTGLKTMFGSMYRNGYELALEEINSKGGIRRGPLKDKKLRFIYQNTLGKPSLAVTLVNRLIDEEKVAMILGGYSSSVCFELAKLCEEREFPHLIDGGSADKIAQQGFKWIFRILHPTSRYTLALEDFLLKVARPKTMAIIYEDTLYGSTGAEKMRDFCIKNNIKVVAQEPYPSDTLNYYPLMIRVKAQNPDIIFMLSYLKDAILLVTQAHELKLSPRMLIGGGAGFTMPGFVAVTGKNAEGLFTASVWHNNVEYPGAKKFLVNYALKFGQIPEYHSAIAYSAVYVIRDVLERTKSLTNAHIRESLRNTELQTIFGRIKFEEFDGFSNQTRLPSFLLQVQKNKLVSVWPPEMAQTKYIIH